MSKKSTDNFWKHECNRCEYIWYSKNAEPKRCAMKKCNSPYWNKKRVR